MKKTIKSVKPESKKVLVKHLFGFAPQLKKWSTKELIEDARKGWETERDKDLISAWKGWIIEESLIDQDILLGLKILKSKIEENDSGVSKIKWILHTVEVNDNEIRKVAEKLKKEIRPGYYIHFTNRKKLLIIFHGKYFIMELDSIGKDEGNGITLFIAKPKDKLIWKSTLEYGIKKGKVDPRYIIEVN